VKKFYLFISEIVCHYSDLSGLKLITWPTEKIFKKQAFKIGELGKKGEIRTTVSLKQI